MYKGKEASILDLFGNNFVLLTGVDNSSWAEAVFDVSSKLGINIKLYRVGEVETLLLKKIFLVNYMG